MKPRYSPAKRSEKDEKVRAARERAARAETRRAGEGTRARGTATHFSGFSAKSEILLKNYIFLDIYIYIYIHGPYI